MKEAKSMEATFYGQNVLGKLTKNYYDNVLGEETTRELTDIFGREAKYLIREFLFGLDCLIEIVNNPETPMKKFLNNVDVDQAFIFICQHRARNEQKSEYFGSQVSPAIAEVLDEFFEYKYLRIIHYVLMHTRSALTIKVDGGTYMLTVNKDFSPTTSHSVLWFYDKDNDGRRISIPFKRVRLVS